MKYQAGSDGFGKSVLVLTILVLNEGGTAGYVYFRRNGRFSIMPKVLVKTSQIK